MPEVDSLASWFATHPQWYRSERELLRRHYARFWCDEYNLERGRLVFYGELVVRPPGGAVRYPVRLAYPSATPYEAPTVTPLLLLPAKPDGSKATAHAPVAEVETRRFDRKHQMPDGLLCLFQRETRAGAPGGDVIRGIDALRRAERWLLGTHTGHWPPDSEDSELELHFHYGGDVLIGSAFYGLPPNGLISGGEFYVVPDLIRSVQFPSRLIYPYIATALTAQVNGVMRTIDARNDLGRLYPWVRGNAWDPQAPATQESLTPAQESHGIERGHWWYLLQEPEPFHDGAGLLREIARALPVSDTNPLDAAWEAVSNRLGAELAIKRLHFFAFCYPSRRGGLDWLVVFMLRPGNDRQDGAGVVIKTTHEKRTTFETDRVFVLRSHSIRPQELGLRNQGVIASGIRTKSVALIGLGALGSRVAELLAQAGVGTFRLCDIDLMTTGNAARHSVGVSSFGMPKVQAVARRLLDINPLLEFEDEQLWQGSAVSSRDDLAAFIASVDLVVSTTADEAVESFVNEVALAGGKPVLYGRALRKGSVGRVFLVRSGSGDACKACLAGYAHRSRSGIPTPNNWIDVPESIDDPVLHECGRPVIPASAVDLSFVASLTARCALNILEEGSSEGTAHRPLSNHWLWVRDGDSSLDERLAAPLSTLLGHVPAAPSCPTCGQGELSEIELRPDAYQIIESLTEESADRETGGVLIGYVEPGSGRVIAVRATGPGPNAIRTPTHFLRDVAYIQQELDKAGSDLGEQGRYIGEWHSHLVASPSPSSTDVESLSGIADSDNYDTQCPVMIIAGRSPVSNNVENINAWAFPAGLGIRRLSLILP